MKNLFKGRQYSYKLIKEAVVMYCHYPLSYRECAELLAYYRIKIDHTTIYRWVKTMGKSFMDCGRNNSVNNSLQILGAWMKPT